MEIVGMLSGAPAPQEGKKLWQYLATISACMLSMGVGTVLAWTAPVLPRLQSPNSWLPLTEEEASWVSSLLAIGAMKGALPAGAIAGALGRKMSLLLLSVPFVVSWILIAWAANVWMLYVARFLAGVGVGAACVLMPTYVSEIAEPSIRGSLGAMFQLLLTFGIVFTFVVAPFLDYMAIALACVAVELIFLVTFIFMPESPAWLMSQGRRSDASAALKRLRGNHIDVAPELAQLQKEVEQSASRKSSVFDLVRLTAPRKALLICSAGMIFQQLSGVNAVLFYTIDIFKAAKSSLEPDVAAILIALVQCIMAFVATGVIDKAGRKPLLMFSAAIMSFSLVTLGLFFKLQETNSDVNNLGWLPLASLILYMIAFSVGMGPIPWMLMSEVFTVELKGNASSLVVTLNWFLVFLVTKTFPTLKNILNSSGAFWFFAVIMALASLFTYYVVPETKGKTIQQIQSELAGKKTNSSV